MFKSPNVRDERCMLTSPDVRHERCMLTSPEENYEKDHVVRLTVFCTFQPFNRHARKPECNLKKKYIYIYIKGVFNAQSTKTVKY